MQSTLADKNINQSNTAFTSCKIHADLCRVLISQSGIKILQYLRIHLTYLSSVMIVLSPLLTDLEMCHASVEVTPHQLGLVSRLLKSSQVDTDNLTRQSSDRPITTSEILWCGEEGGRRAWWVGSLGTGVVTVDHSLLWLMWPKTYKDWGSRDQETQEVLIKLLFILLLIWSTWEHTFILIFNDL